MNIKNLALGIAIVVLTSFVSIYGIQTFYSREPLYDNFCNRSFYRSDIINNSADCRAVGGMWNEYPSYDNNPEIGEVKKLSGYCDVEYTCRREFEAAIKRYSRDLFIITIPVGVLLIIVGAALFSIEFIGAGIMLGGVITLIYGSSRYWPMADNFFKFIISLIGLVVVIFFGYWLNKKGDSIKKKILK
ncbi:MAG: hypothetical protein QXJ28_02110 [Candidatus Pacearchaeota archaeon]